MGHRLAVLGTAGKCVVYSKLLHIFPYILLMLYIGNFVLFFFSSFFSWLYFFFLNNEEWRGKYYPKRGAWLLKHPVTESLILKWLPDSYLGSSILVKVQGNYENLHASSIPLHWKIKPSKMFLRFGVRFDIFKLDSSCNFPDLSFLTNNAFWSTILV